MTKPNVTNNDDLRVWLMIATCLLVFATIPIWPYGLYTLLRILVCGISVYAAIRVGKSDLFRTHKIPLIVIAVLFNPLLPVYLVRLVWIPIDLGIALYFLILRRKLQVP